MGWDDWAFGIPTVGGYNAVKYGINKLTDSPGDAQEAARKKLLEEQAAAAGNFADYGEGGVQSLGGQMDTARQQFLDQATGKLSYSKEALRQGLMQNQAAQRSMAASASVRNGPMAALAGAQNAARLGSGMAGQSALAGIAEQQGAAKLYADATAQQRQQDLQAALQSRANATSGYGAGNAGVPEKSFAEKYGPTLISGAAAFSDRRLKKNVAKADDGARLKLEALQAYAYDYKNKKHGKERQLGVMAQDLEKAGLGQAVIDTPEGKIVHGAKLAGANTAMLAALGKRVSELEGGKRK